MTTNSSTVVRTVQAGLGKNSQTNTLGTGEAQIQEIILDEAFVAQVREAATALDLTGVSYYNYVANVVVKLLESLGEMVSLPDVREALNYLAESGEITLPALASV